MGTRALPRPSRIAAAAIVVGALSARPAAILPTSPLESVALRPGSTIRIAGDSNLHEWSCEARALESTLRMDPAAADHLPTSVEAAHIALPVSDLRCGNDKIDENLRKALNVKDHPSIEYRLVRADFAAVTRVDSVDVTVTGMLTVAGADRELTMKVLLTDTGDGGIRAQGRAAIRMTDFGVKPPTALLGLLKTRDDVTIEIDLTADFAETQASGQIVPTN